MSIYGGEKDSVWPTTSSTNKLIGRWAFAAHEWRRGIGLFGKTRNQRRRLWLFFEAVGRDDLSQLSAVSQAETLSTVRGKLCKCSSLSLRPMKWSDESASLSPWVTKLQDNYDYTSSLSPRGAEDHHGNFLFMCAQSSGVPTFTRFTLHFVLRFSKRLEPPRRIELIFFLQRGWHVALSSFAEWIA